MTKKFKLNHHLRIDLHTITLITVIEIIRIIMIIIIMMMMICIIMRTVERIIKTISGMIMI